MSRCIQLAQCGKMGAAPNPMVGAVIVCHDKIIGEGYHRRCGGPHAEVNAIASVNDTSQLSSSTIYVSLEPCSHYGKTPPCADLIIKHKIPRVVVGCIDPFAKVAGRGIQKLREAGLEVIVGVLEKECLQLNKRFITSHTQKRPYITLKWAESADHFIDKERVDGKAYAFSTPLTRMLVHKQRAENMSIMVGRKTALLDNPSLNVRDWIGNDPLRLVIDRQLTLPSHLKLFTDGKPTLCFTAKEKEATSSVEYITLNFEHPILPQIVTLLYHRNIQTLMVEGGSQLLQSFITAELWDEAYVESTEDILHSGVRAPQISQFKSIDQKWFAKNRITHYIRFLS